MTPPSEVEEALAKYSGNYCVVQLAHPADAHIANDACALAKEVRSLRSRLAEVPEDITAACASWQSRAESSEREAAGMREALEELSEFGWSSLRPDGLYRSQEELSGLLCEVARIARSALTQQGGEGQK
jgi:hypothetical protein